MAFSIDFGVLSIDMVPPTAWPMTVDTMSAEHKMLNGSVKRDRRAGAATRRYRVALKWDELATSEADDIENAWLYLVADPTRTGTLTAPNGDTFTASVDPKDRAFSREPFAKGDGVDAFMVAMVLRLEIV